MSQAEHVAKHARRQALRDRVEAAWIDEPMRPPGSLDASLKKHTTLLNRLKTMLLVGPSDALIKELDGLTLSKYLEEIVAAVVEGASRGKGDPEVAVNVIVHLHTRLAPDFFPLVLPPLLAVLAPSATLAKDAGDKEDKERISRQRIVLRIVAELALVSAWPEGPSKGAGEVGKTLNKLMAGDAQFLNLAVLTTFLRYFSRTFLGPKPSDAQQGLPEGVGELVPVEMQAKMRELFMGYFNSASKTLVKGQVKLLEQDKKNHEAYIKSGEIFEDRQHAYEKMTKAVERLTAGVQSLADLLGTTPPTLPTAASLNKSGLQIVEGQSSFTVRDQGTGGIWDDDEEQRFYEDIIDLKDFVPASFLGIKPGKDGGEEEDREGREDAEMAKAAQIQDEEDIRRQLEQLDLERPAEPVEPVEYPVSVDNSAAVSPKEAAGALEDEPMVDSIVESAPGDDEGLSSGPAARLDALLAALPEAVNREMIDRLVVEFASLNSKAARKRLVKFIGSVNKSRTDLLPHYARLVATLDPYMPDVTSGILDILDEEMRYLQRKRHVRELDSVRLKNVRFYGELAKFKVARPHTILHVLKVFLDEFKWNIENIANLLESCGRFLLRYEGTAETAKKMVELMRRKQATSNLDQRHNVMLENAFYMCNPPERVARQVVQLSPIEAFIQHLLHDVLMKRTLDKVLRLMRKLHWEDPATYDFLLRSMTRVWEVKFENIPHVAALVYDLQRYHPEFGVAVVDQVLEDIRAGMEENIFKHNQRRISSIRYLGELYMYRVIGAPLIFDVLWSLISFGHPEGLPIPGRDSPIDAVDDFFRVRQVCTLLDTCGACFNRGSQKRRLDQFLVVFQLYVQCKTDVPMDVDFMLNDTMESLHPKVTRMTTFAEAAAAVDEMLASKVQVVTVDDIDADGVREVEDTATEDGTEIGEEDGRQEDSDADEEDSDDDDNDDNDDEEEEDVAVYRQRVQDDEADLEARSDFDREFSKMLADTTDSRRGEQRKAVTSVFDTAVPLIKRKAAAGGGGPSSSIGGRGGEGGAGPAGARGGMAFTLLSKRGNKQQLKTLDVPLDSALALNSISNIQRNKAEQEQLKRLVLQNERRLELSEQQAAENDMRSRGIRVRHLQT